MHPFQNTIETLYKYGIFFGGHVLRGLKNDILDKNIFCNSDRNPLFSQSFLINNIFKTKNGLTKIKPLVKIRLCLID